MMPPRKQQPLALGGTATLVRLLCIASCLIAVAAFDKEGHDAQGQTCASAMDQEAIKGMKRLLNGQDASDVAGWGHDVDDTYPDMAKLHFQARPDPFCEEGKEATLPSTCEDNICLLPAIKHFYGRILQDEGRALPKDHPALDTEKVAKGLKFTDADEVKLLINLIGDLHQPLHVGFSNDDVGKKTQVRFRGKEMSLYEFWDAHIGEVVRKDEASFWLGGWTHVGRIRTEFESDKAAWKKDGAYAMFDKWAAESAKFSCTTAYKHPSNGKWLAGPKAEGGVVEIDEAAYQEWRAAWLRQILLAGERTAIVLNDILDDKGAKKLSDGSKITTKADTEAEVQKAKDEKERQEWRAANPQHAAGGGSSITMAAPYSMTNFLINCLIAAFIVPCVVGVATYGLNPLDVKALLAQLEGSGNGSDSSDSQGSGPQYKPGSAKRSN